jgi:hypothetical protein
MDFYYDIDGNPISLEEWMAARKGREHISEQIARTESRRDDITVSTVFTGLNLTPLADKPMIFETMVFGVYFHRWAEDNYTRRYSTKAEALAGHEEVCKLVFGEPV